MIKLFEEYNQYYTEISRLSDDWGIYVSFDKLPFNVDEHKYIMKNLSDIGYSNIYNDDDAIRIRFKPVVLDIYKDQDEWFWVARDTPRELTFYKCDQLEGLIKCLKDIYDKVV